METLGALKAAFQKDGTVTAATLRRERRRSGSRCDVS
jgi:hypothetical protein